MFRFTNISRALLRHGHFIKHYYKHYSVSCVLVQSNHIGAQYNVEQYVLNRWHLTLTEQLENFQNSKLALAYIFLICLFKSRSLFFVDIVIPRYLQFSTIGIFKSLRKNDGGLILIVLSLKHKEID